MHHKAKAPTPVLNDALPIPPPISTIPQNMSGGLPPPPPPPPPPPSTSKPTDGPSAPAPPPPPPVPISGGGGGGGIGGQRANLLKEIELGKALKVCSSH